jgi:eukaryotic-like serine/threonine-protein kinase
LAASNLDQLQNALGTSYTIERELGRGGMATVYLARDTKHRRPVALKVLQPDLAATLGPERFRREIATVAQLQHPHILGVHDSGETPDGQLWFTMPYVEGETLRSRLRREHQLPVEDALRITREIAGALDYAHEAGVIHRDIKPENILLTKRGDALLADFGIARALTEGSSDTGGQRIGLTMTGLAVGTPQYMSPEQASGERGLDARSDVYALGAVCYEMLAGEPPFSGPSPQVVVAKMLTTDAPSVRILRPGASPELDAVLARALARVPADRWPSAGELSRALGHAEQLLHTSSAGVSPGAPIDRPLASPSRRRRRFPVAALALALGFVIGAGLLFAWRAKGPGAVAPDSASGGVRLAVLPFDNLGDSSDAYFADGVTDAVRGKLTSVAGLGVIGSTSSGQYRHTTKSPQQIGDELGVRYLLIGKVRWAKGPNGTSRVQVSPELVDVRTGQDAWAEPFNAPITDVFQVQADIADRVAHKLSIALTPAAQQTITEKPTTDVVAYDSYLRGLQVLREGGSTIPTYRRAVALAREAVQRDSNFVLAWAMLSTSYANLYENGVVDAEAPDSIRVISARALALAPGSPAAHRARAVYYSTVANDNERAITEDQTAVALEPRETRWLASLAQDLVKAGRWDEAITCLNRALQLDPRNYVAWQTLGQALTRQRRISEARTASEKADELQPNRVDQLQDRIYLDLMRGDITSAHAKMARALQSMDSASLIAYMATYQDLGWVLDSAQERILLALGPAEFDNDHAQWAFSRAEQYFHRGDTARARVWADTARIEYKRQLKDFPTDAQRVANYALSIAYLGKADEAVSEAKRAVSMMTVSQNYTTGLYVEYQLLRVYLALGRADDALNEIEHFLSVPGNLTAGWMRIDPDYRGLTGNPRFEKILASAKPIA